MNAQKKFLPLLILLGGVGIVVILILTKPAPERRNSPPVTPQVEVLLLKKKDYLVKIHTQGTVQARTESTLIPEVSGRIIETLPGFREGAFFEKGELLLRLENQDYKAGLLTAQAELAGAKLQYEEEKARAEQAEKDWTKLGKGSQASPLLLRKPQLAKAEALVASAKARVGQAKRNLERTRITAPYAGRLLEKRVDLGQFVSPGTVLAHIYAVDYAEIRLPLSDKELSFIELPEVYRGESSVKKTGPYVKFSASFGEKEHFWEGTLVRSEGAIDIKSRQHFVVAQVKNPYGLQKPNRPPLKVGLFVQAEIEGRLLKNVIVIPRSALRGGKEVLVVDKTKKTLHRKKVDLLWSDSEELVIKSGLHAGDLLCLTPLAYAVEGIPVTTQLDLPSQKKSKAPLEEPKKSKRTRKS